MSCLPIFPSLTLAHSLARFLFSHARLLSLFLSLTHSSLGESPLSLSPHRLAPLIVLPLIHHRPYPHHFQASFPPSLIPPPPFIRSDTTPSTAGPSFILH
ncbi:hypothetical protein BC939DRAFT_175052 [Gamsiella multidivaricata]|uniref:uncharacterized protein n=1 Tax=Gamsiella multidivaricata TaxID=101098 RepID=UPI00221F08A6|nr:uncharacterized protein BC939DRAFT_175052 [Gamsiella multidivaricata]KAI7822630.1 hypothetical protein BC939DRAFT_175052 [Gamsiella multidivaricata]